MRETFLSTMSRAIGSLPRPHKIMFQLRAELARLTVQAGRLKKDLAKREKDIAKITEERDKAMERASVLADERSRMKRHIEELRGLNEDLIQRGFKFGSDVYPIYDQPLSSFLPVGTDYREVKYRTAQSRPTRMGVAVHWDYHTYMGREWGQREHTLIKGMADALAGQVFLSILKHYDPERAARIEAQQKPSRPRRV